MSERLGSHLFHNTGAMNLDSALTYAQFASYDFVGLTLHDQIKNLPFARSQLRQALRDRERQILDLVVQGKANKIIAGELSVSQCTVPRP